MTPSPEVAAVLRKAAELIERCECGHRGWSHEHSTGPNRLPLGSCYLCDCAALRAAAGEEGP